MFAFVVVVVDDDDDDDDDGRAGYVVDLGLVGVVGLDIAWLCTRTRVRSGRSQAQKATQNS